MPCDASGGTVRSSGAIGFTAPDSGVAPASPTFTTEDPVVSAVAPGIIADPSTVGVNYSPPLSLPAAMVDSSVGHRAPGHSGMGSTGMSSALGPAFGCSSVWTGGVDSSVRLALHQISSSITKKKDKDMTTK